MSTDATNTATTTPAKSNSTINLFDYTEEQLLDADDREFTHYELLNLQSHCSSDEIKKAYRRQSLKYHPDKTGRGADDYVFLAVKEAYQVLSDPEKRQAYDSTTIPFDESIPNGVLGEDEDFYDTFQPVFERNLRFDAKQRPDLNKKKKKPSKKNEEKSKPPSLGDEATPMEEVHAFYDYWVHFESWRDFTDTAAEELEVADLEADSRAERRWYQQKVDKRAKQLKRVEMQRVQSLVAAAMQADPRLQKEKEAQKTAQAERKAAVAAERQEQAERAATLREERQRTQKVIEEKQKQEKVRILQEQAVEPEAQVKKPWSKEELAALAKASKKFPPGSGIRRWDQIAAAVGRSAQECTEMYNQVTRLGNSKGSASAPSTLSTNNADASATWTSKQDQQLKAALATYPASMDKNERWASIAKAVDDKSKKECVHRFKSIREALIATKK